MPSHEAAGEALTPAAHRTQSEEIRELSDMEIPSTSHETTERSVITSTPMAANEVRA
jgi:hypothetical protein